MWGGGGGRKDVENVFRVHNYSLIINTDTILQKQYLFRDCTTVKMIVSSVSVNKEHLVAATVLFINHDGFSV